MRKIYECSPKSLLSDMEAFTAFMSCFDYNDRLQIASLCLMFNCKEKYPEIETNLKDNKAKIFNCIDRQCNVIKTSLKSSYEEAKEK